ncbi:MAG TPA: hypothetical protein VFZ73_00910 [Gemmatimonadaceae bacterium]
MTQTQLQPSVPVETAISSADVVIGIATYNNADTIVHALRAIDAACRELSGDAACAVVHADGASTDGTAEQVANTRLDSAPVVPLTYPMAVGDKFSGPYRGVPAKGNAVRAIFDTAQRLGAKACVIVDVEVNQFSAGWLDSLARPVLLNGRDFVTAYYTRHQFSGAINNGVAYPLTRALYGKRVRFPVGGDFACSRTFIERSLGQPAWDMEPVKSSIDLWLATRAMSDGSRLGQAAVGVKYQAWKEAGPGAAEPLAKILAALFEGATRWQAMWQKVRGSEPVQTYGFVEAVDETPVSVSVKRGIESFRLAQRHLDEIWKFVLPPRTLLELKKLATLAEPDFRVPDDIWARIVYDFLIAYHQRTLNREHVLSAFAPLFAAWLSSFVSELQDASLAESEERIDRMCLRFESEKPYLISRWRWPDRFSP